MKAESHYIWHRQNLFLRNPSNFENMFTLRAILIWLQTTFMLRLAMQSTFFQTSFTFAENVFLLNFRNIYSYHISLFTTIFYKLVSNIPVFKAMLKHLKTPSEAGRLNNLCEARNREGLGLSYRPARLHRLAGLVPWNRFFWGSFKV